MRPGGEAPAIGSSPLAIVARFSARESQSAGRGARKPLGFRPDDPGWLLEAGG